MAALPWGRPAAPTEAVDRDLAATLGLGPGARIEVLWELADDDSEEEAEEAEEGEAEPRVKWWPATLQGPLPAADEADAAAAPPAGAGAEPAGAEPAPRAADGEGRTGYSLIYDADAGAGHADPAQARVTFLSEHELYDLGEDEVLSWRRAGAAWEPAPQHRLAGVPVAARPAPGGRAGAAGVAVRLDDVAAALRRGERLRGASDDAGLGALLGALPPALARGAANGFSRLTSAVADGLRRLHEEHGEEYVVQEGDVVAILARVDPDLAKRVKRQRR